MSRPMYSSMYRSHSAYIRASSSGVISSPPSSWTKSRRPARPHSIRYRLPSLPTAASAAFRYATCCRVV
jgi:hypothetical protein